ncbi:low molecular weight protein tyrosine phosphatase [Fusibacter sp. 3D3]|nr:low molecular weight protein tyrosine phosphatase [Fusibacter sp. 3D3]
MAEYVMKDLVAKHRLSDVFEIASAATSTEEIGNDVHRGTRQILTAHGDIADPWYTGDFEITYQDVMKGCEGLLCYLTSKTHQEKPARF